MAFLFNFMNSKAYSAEYEISKVALSIKNFIQNDKLYVNINLPEGLEIPDEYQTWEYQKKNGLCCEFSVKVVDGKKFLDSEGYPLTNLTFAIHVINNFEKQSMVLVVEENIEVVQRGFVYDETHRTKTTSRYQFEKMQLNLVNRPELSKSKENPSLGNVSFDIISTD